MLLPKEGEFFLGKISEANHMAKNTVPKDYKQFGAIILEQDICMQQDMQLIE